MIDKIYVHSTSAQLKKMGEKTKKKSTFFKLNYNRTLREIIQVCRVSGKKNNFNELFKSRVFEKGVTVMHNGIIINLSF